ncbi:MAG: tetraacyldisaccharide 4'-kinase [Vicinamibacterales bacterium]
MISSIYAAAVRRRREWYAARPQARRRLRRPVISIGNIAVGGRGKTPFTAAVARILLEMGEVPAILSRGYRRTDPSEGAVIVRDRRGLRADLARAGDEPLMLAQQLHGAIVMSGADRYISGCVAELQLGASVHLLDDGFQHLQLDRDVDIVLVAEPDLTGKTLPGGRLREPADVLIAADAIVALQDTTRITAPHAAVFGVRRSVAPVKFDSSGGAAPATGAPVMAVAGIADPVPFLTAVKEHGWNVTATRTFADHHPYSRRDLDELVAAARNAGAVAILTTEKDLVRLRPYRPFAMPLGWAPLTMEPEPPDEFRRWLAVALGTARDSIIG